MTCSLNRKLKRSDFARLPEEFKDARYYYLLLGLSREEARIALSFKKIGRTKRGRDYDPVSLAKVVAVLNDKRYYKAVEGLLDHNTLYKLIVEDGLKEIDAAMTKERRAERMLFYGGARTGFSAEFLKKQFLLALEAKTNSPFNAQGIEEVISNSNAREVEDYIIATLNNQENLTAVVTALLMTISSKHEKGEFSDHLLEIVSRFSRSSNNNNDAAAHTMRVMEVLRSAISVLKNKEVIRRVYSSIKLEQVILIYDPLKHEGSTIPQLTIGSLIEVMLSSPALLQEVFTRGLLLCEK
jgi:hypothetical protein